MAIQAGQRLGPFEILSAIGAGGMGEVYKARDTRLNRIVAVKVLPDHFAESPASRERFEREARTIASLNHPHICTLHDIGHQDGMDYLVLEYLEGETLAQRLQKGPLPLELTLQYAVEIADALDKAHRKGITHRDLKPGNIMLTKCGTKLLDFGLAKLAKGAAPVNPESQLPTMKDAVTAQGTILGTLQYMAPEQVEGKTDQIDARTDIFAFGVLVYEMATGKKAFEGTSQASLVAKILETDPPPVSSLQPMTPPTFDRLVKKCLAKEPDRRWQSASDVCDELKWVMESGLEVARATSGATLLRRTNRRALLLGSVVFLAVMTVAFVLENRMRSSQRQARPIARVVMGPPPSDRLAVGANVEPLALSPDGSRLVYVASRGGVRQLFVRSIDRFDPTPIPGTEGAASVYFSPDGQSVAFVAQGRPAELKKVSLSGGAPLNLCTVIGPRGASWGPDDTIIFTAYTNQGLSKISVAGGTPKPLTVPDRKAGEYGHLWPQILPGGKAVLFTIWTGVGGIERARIAVVSLETGKQKTLIEGGTYARYISSGHIVYARAGGLLAVPFDLQRLEVTGSPVSIVEGVGMDPNFGAAFFSTSAEGSLAYIPGGLSGTDNTLVWVDRAGAGQSLPAPPRGYDTPRISPDGHRIAVGLNGVNPGLWIYDSPRGTLTKLVEAGVISPYPLWTPDGKRLTFKAPLGDPTNLYWMPADGSGAPEQLTTGESNKWPGSWSPDGRVLAFQVLDPNPAIAVIQLLDLGGGPNAHPFSQSPTSAYGPVFSPDGHWLSYSSNESGRSEIYITPYPGPGSKLQISTDGGIEPVWNRNGRELFYRNANKLMAVDVKTQPTFSAGKPKMLFDDRYAPANGAPANYDVSPDGQRFLMIKASEATTPTQINVVLNWFEELKQKVPTGKK